MMKQKAFWSVLLVIVLASCTVKETTNTTPLVRTLDFTEKTFLKQSSLCGIDSGICATYEVKYPVFEVSDTSLNRFIQKKIDQYVSMGNPMAEGWRMDSIAADFIRGYESFQKENEGFEPGIWFYHANVNVETAVDTLISLSVKDEYYTGGAHGGTNTYFININPTTKEDFTLDNYFKPGYREALTRFGEESFRKERGLGPDESLNENGFEFPQDVFRLNDNYGFTKDGIVFVFNSYEIAPYVYGPTHFLIRYDKF